MDPHKDRHTHYSLDSSRVSQSSNTVPQNIQVKKMEAKLLMDYYKQNQQQKQRQYMGQNYDKVNYGQYQQSLTQNFNSQQQSKRRSKQQIRQKLAQQYNQMIRFKQQKARQQKQQVLKQQKRNLQISPWGRDTKQDVLKHKKIQHQYGKQLQMHLRLQQIQKYEHRQKQRQAVQKYQKQQYEQNIKSDKNQLSLFKRKQQFEKRQNQILGINNFYPNPQTLQMVHSVQLQKNDIRAIKRRQQLLYGTGLQQQLRSQTISPKMNQKLFNQKQFNQKILNQTNKTNQISQKLFTDHNMFKSQVYNPITNPIQLNYKNPYVLRMLSQNSN